MNSSLWSLPRAWISQLSRQRSLRDHSQVSERQVPDGAEDRVGGVAALRRSGRRGTLPIRRPRQAVIL